ncbi:MAG: proline--tRNA ligase [Clostridiales bacterium]|nr:proline--tRNA ligase [Clostridiales bacterium]
MKLSKLVGERTKEVPSSATVKSQAFLMRAGYIKQVSNGIYSLLTPGQKVSYKIQNIIREEMNKIDGQEVLMPVVMPREMWDESGRYSSIGSEMVRFKDRSGHDMLLGMTHEEAAVHLARNLVKSYEQLPFMIYQIQTKFRDEARSRAGLIRVREFTMKDAYSFHASQKDLEEYYNKVYDAYFNIYNRLGLKNVISVASDSGMMGGKIAHEYMLLTDIGEDSIAICPECSYRANVEVAKGILDKSFNNEQPLEEVYTGNAKSIDEICQFFNIQPNQTCKAVCYAMEGEQEKSLLAFVRGDLEVNEAKLKALIGRDVAPKDLDNSILVKGNIGPLNLNNDNLIIVYDESLKDENNLICGANKEEYHIKGLNISRDLVGVEFHDISKVKDGEICVECGKGVLKISRGVEIGNIFQLGTKYTKPMNMTVHAQNGEEINPIMGCYGIGVGRNLACIAEEGSDEKGLIWNMNVAPWEVVICPLRIDDEVVCDKANSLYLELKNKGVDVLFDDRDNVSAGVKFADSELMGIPVRVVVSPRSLSSGEVEVAFRSTGEKKMVKYDEIVSYLIKYINEQKF